jgi:hypothetical protein
MFTDAQKWLKSNWWGLIVAYVIILFAMYCFIWTILEPLGISDIIASPPHFTQTRVFYHVGLALLISPYITLILDLALRRTRSRSGDSLREERILGGTWKGSYTTLNNNKSRQATLCIEFVNHKIMATMTTQTDQGTVVQKVNSADLISTASFDLCANSVTVAAERKTPWRPETWRCTLSKDAQEDERLIVEINDVTKAGSGRTVAGFNMYKKA